MANERNHVRTVLPEMILLYPFIDRSQNVQTLKKTPRDLRLSLANKRNHVRTVLPGMICAVSVH